MRWATISKNLAASAVPPNLLDCDRARVESDWTKARRCLDGLPAGGDLLLGTEGTLLEWLVAPGATVHRGDIVAVFAPAPAAATAPPIALPAGDRAAALRRATAHLATLNAERPVTSGLVPVAALLKAAALAARKISHVNGSWVDDVLVPAQHVHLGVAVSLRTVGLLVTAIHDADTLSLDELMAAARCRPPRDRRTRGRTLPVSDLEDLLAHPEEL